MRWGDVARLLGIARRFPIPMRGNEMLPSFLRAGNGGMFPIPMRGNEDREAECARCGRTGFRSP